jgi:hypothetical protein
MDHYFEVRLVHPGRSTAKELEIDHQHSCMLRYLHHYFSLDSIMVQCTIQVVCTFRQLNQIVRDHTSLKSSLWCESIPLI